MNVLCINTAFSRADVMLSADNNNYFESLDSSCKHSENVLPCIDRQFEKSGINVKDINYISVVVGPGSFTGVRISTALAKGFMVAHDNIKAVSVNSLELIAFDFFENNIDKQEVFVVLNALSRNYFIAKYNKNLTAIITPQMVSTDELEKLVKLEKDIATCYEDYPNNEKSCKILPETLLKLTMKKIIDKNICEENELLPIYLRLSQAEVELIKKENKK